MQNVLCNMFLRLGLYQNIPTRDVVFNNKYTKLFAVISNAIRTLWSSHQAVLTASNIDFFRHFVLPSDNVISISLHESVFLTFCH